MSDPEAEEKDRRTRETAVALAALYVAARADMLNLVRDGHVRDALRMIWVEKLEQRVRSECGVTAEAIGTRVLERLTGDGGPGFSLSNLDAYIDAAAKGFAGGWQQAVESMLGEIDLAAPDLVAEAEVVTQHIVDAAQDEAADLTQAAAGVATSDAAKTAGMTTKTWHHRAGDDGGVRASHLAQDGLTIGIAERFPNGQRFPGSPAPPAERLNCNCYLTYGR